MTRDVSSQISAVTIPTTVGLSSRFEPGARPIERQHPVGLELEEVSGIQILCMLERAARQTDRR